MSNGVTSRKFFAGNRRVNCRQLSDQDAYATTEKSAHCMILWQRGGRELRINPHVS